MHTSSLRSLLESKLCHSPTFAWFQLTTFRQHPAVTSQAARIFVYVAQALEAEALAGQNAARVVAATKLLLEGTSTDPTPLLQQFTPEAQNVIRAHFA